MQAVAAAFGRIHLLASNAGVEHFGKLEDLTREDFARVFATNVGGQLFATQAAVPYMQPGSRIVLTSSVSAKLPVLHHTLYAASKAAVSAMALNLAPELAARGITINAIAPGGTQTDMAKEVAALYTPPVLRDIDPMLAIKSQSVLQRLAEAPEIAAAVLFLLSEDASYMTGSTLAVDGGLH